MRELFRDPRFRLFFAGQVASMAGDSLMLLVLAVWVQDLTGSSGMAGAVILVIACPALLAPLLGWVVDRVRRKPLLVLVNLASAVVLLSLLAVHGRRDVWIIYTVAFGYGLSFNLNAGALSGLLKELVTDERLVDANGGLRTVREGLRLVGPLIGTGLYAWAGAAPVVLADVVSFVVAAASLAAIRLSEAGPQRERSTWLHEVGEGFRHVFAGTVLRRISLAMAVAFLAFSTVESGVYAFIVHGLHRPAVFAGVLMTAMGVGSIAGGLAAPPVVRRIGELGSVAVGLLAMALGLGPAVYPSPPVWAALAAIPFAGVGVSLSAVAFATAMQRYTPGPLMGRVSSALDVLIGVPQTVSIAIGALIVSRVDYRWLFGTAAGGLVLVATVVWMARAPGRDGSGDLAPVVLPGAIPGTGDAVVAGAPAPRTAPDPAH